MTRALNYYNMRAIERYVWAIITIYKLYRIYKSVITIYISNKILVVDYYIMNIR